MRKCKHIENVDNLWNYSPDELPSWFDTDADVYEEGGVVVGPEVDMFRTIVAKTLADAFGPDEICVLSSGVARTRFCTDVDARHEARRWLGGYLSNRLRAVDDSIETETEVSRRDTICAIAGVTPEQLKLVFERLKCSEESTKEATVHQFRLLVDRLADLNRNLHRKCVL